ncbi:MAG: DHH family phosphoesterase [Nitrososphaerota archaeon]|nr:DHH family phosphoesterase [Candidatus Bathyarchaeota archaeon]MDW8048398.1 DHH family phosphoesterase [Nitrososphaerota archaeon]
MSIQDIKSLIGKSKVESIIILCHQNADPDAICSAYVFSQLLRRLIEGANIQIVCPEGVSKLSKEVCNFIPINYVELEAEEFDLELVDLIIMVDTNTIQQLGGWKEKIKESKSPLIVIDHHAIHHETEKIAALIVSDEKSSSTCEIIYTFFKSLGIKPSKTEAEALILGIAFDTKHFTLANSSTFKIIADLVDVGVDAREVLSRLSVKMDISERIARLKACKRLELMRLGKWLIVFSHVRSYQASASRALVDMGAHVAIVAGQKKGTLQISIRSDQQFYKETGFHLGRDLAKPLGECLNGMGGGHSTAAGVNCVGNFENVVKEAAKIIRERLSEQ